MEKQQGHINATQRSNEINTINEASRRRPVLFKFRQIQTRRACLRLAKGNISTLIATAVAAAAMAKALFIIPCDKTTSALFLAYSFSKTHFCSKEARFQVGIYLCQRNLSNKYSHTAPKLKYPLHCSLWNFKWKNEKNLHITIIFVWLIKCW